MAVPVFRQVARRSALSRSIVRCTTGISGIHSSSHRRQEDRANRPHLTRDSKQKSRNEGRQNNLRMNPQIRDQISTKTSGKALKRAIKKELNEMDPKSSSDSQSPLAKCNKIMEKLLQRRGKLPLPPINWLYLDPIDGADLYVREELYRDTVALTRAIELSINAKKIRASSGRENRDLTSILGNILLIYSETPPKRLFSTKEMGLPSTIQSCTKVLNLIKQLNFDIQPIHHFCAIRAANQEHEWNVASSLFQKQIDPDKNGLVPVDPTLGWDSHVEMGLFGLAMDLRTSNTESCTTHAVQGLLNAVRDMCMVSPTDQEKYILAAGSALGLVGEWKACVGYLEGRPDTAEFGQTLHAAMMNACYINGEYDMVLHLYYNMLNDIETGAQEWQWGGEFSKSHPLCIDLMLRAMGQQADDAVENIDGLSDGATAILGEIVATGGNVSLEAIKGVLQTCENDANFEKAVEILQILQNYDPVKSDWSIVDESIENFLYKSEPLAMNIQPIDADILASVMKTCNFAEEYALSLLSLRITPCSKSPQCDPEYSPQGIVETLLSRQQFLYENENLLGTTFTALCGVRCTKEALQLEAEVRSSGGDQDKTITLLDHLSDIDTITSSGVSWQESYRHIDRVLYAADSINKTNHSLSKEDQYQLSLGVATMLRHSIECGHHNAGIMVAQLIANVASSHKAASVKETVKSFFGLENEDSGKNFWCTSDELLSTMIRVYRNKFGTHEALLLFFEEWNKSGGLQSGVKRGNPEDFWIKSCNIALNMLLEQGNVDRAEVFFETIAPTCRNPETYAIMADGYSRLGKWKDVGGCYADAKRNNCLSERLTFLAMEDIAKADISDKIKTLRKVAENIAELKGMKTGAWITDNYWELKRRLGYHYARLLMWWNDPSESQVQELRLASQHLTDWKRKGTSLDEDIFHCIIRLAGERVKDGESKQQERPHIEEKPESLVFKALEELCCFDSANKDQLLDKGMRKLVKMNAKFEFNELLRHANATGTEINKATISDATRAFTGQN